MIETYKEPGNGAVEFARTYVEGLRMSAALPVIFWEISEDEALERMSESATLRRSLKPGQRAAITLEFADLVEKIRVEAKSRSGMRTDLDPSLERGSRTNEILAEKAGIGKSSMAMLQAVQRDEPELFDKVKSGDWTINKAYTETKKRKQVEKIRAEAKERQRKAADETNKKLGRSTAETVVEDFPQAK